MENKQIKAFVFLCCLVYFTSYITRINYGAVISEIIKSEGILKSQAGIVTTASFISYGFGQIISGIMGDKFNPKKLIFFGLIATALCNICIALVSNITVMAIIWFMNGFAQAFMWPPLVKCMTMYLDDTLCKKACVSVTICASVATVVIYIIAPLLISLGGWRCVFVASAIMAIATSLLWNFKMRKMKEKETPTINKEKPKISMNFILATGLIYIGIAIILQGILRDGIITWMPSFIIETFDLSSKVAILTTVILPIFAIICLKITSYVNQKYIKNEIVSSAFFFGIGFLVCVLMRLFYLSSAIVAVILSAIIAGCMHGVNLMLIGLLPTKFEKFGCVSTVSGVLNSLTYVGSALSSYGFAKMSEMFGWSFSLSMWIVIAILGTAFCTISIKKSKIIE